MVFPAGGLMRRVLAASACFLYLGLANCAGRQTEPSGQVLQGRWGAAEDGRVLLVADSAATVLYFGCSAINTPKLVELTADGKFAFQGTYYPPTPGPVARKPGVADVMGKVQGNTVVLTYDV